MIALKIALICEAKTYGCCPTTAIVLTWLVYSEERWLLAPTKLVSISFFARSGVGKTHRDSYLLWQDLCCSALIVARC